MDFAVPANHREKQKESEKRDKYLDFAREQKKKNSMEHESDVIPIVIGALGTVNKGWVTETGRLENKRTRFGFVWFLCLMAYLPLYVI